MGSISKYVGPPQGTPYPLATLSPKVEAVDLLRELSESNRQIANAVSIKLKLIQSQIDHLQMEAIKIVESAKKDMELHKVACHVQKRVGVTYFLYERADGSQFFSILSPEDWGNMIPGKFNSAWSLNPDMSWVEVT